MYHCFHCQQQGTQWDRFLAIEQEDDVSEYLQRFEELSVSVAGRAGGYIYQWVWLSNSYESVFNESCGPRRNDGCGPFS